MKQRRHLSQPDMQPLRDTLPLDYPITGLCIVSDPGRCPAGYTVVSRCHDTSDDADLWKDGFFKKKVTRFLCITRIFPLANGTLNNVLADVAIINDHDSMPAQFSRIDETVDTREKAMKKRVMCVKMIPRHSTNSAICEIIFLAKSKRPPAGFTLIGDVNNLLLCIKMGPVPQNQAPGLQRQQSAPQQNLPYSVNPSLQPYMPQHISSSVPNQSTPRTEAVQGHEDLSQNSGLPYPIPNKRNSVGITRQPSTYNTASRTVSSPIAGIPFQLSSKFVDNNLKNIMVPQISYKSMMEVITEYDYPFQIEQSAAARTPPELE